VKFEQVNVDMKNPDHEKRVSYKSYEAKPCTEEDFTHDEATEDGNIKLKHVWKKFKDHLILCPKIEDEDDLTLENDATSPKSKHF